MASDIDICHCYRNEANRGVSYSRNRALKLAKGNYVWFVDPDDLLCPGSVKRFLECAKQSHADVALGNYARIAESFFAANENMLYVDKACFHAMDEMQLPQDNAGKMMCAIWAGLFRRSFLLEHELLFRENMIAQEDTLFYYEVEQHSPRMIKTEAICYLYRQRTSSVMHQKSELRMQKYYQSMRIMLDVYTDYWKAGTYKDKSVLEEKILHSHENVCACLAKCTDERFVKKEFAELKKQGYYPYPFRKKTLQRKDSIIVRVLDYLLPIEICFWIAHIIYAAVNMKRFT